MFVSNNCIPCHLLSLSRGFCCNILIMITDYWTRELWHCQCWADMNNVCSVFVSECIIFAFCITMVTKNYVFDFLTISPVNTIWHLCIRYTFFVSCRITLHYGYFLTRINCFTITKHIIFKKSMLVDIGISIVRFFKLKMLFCSRVRTKCK